MQGKMAIRIVLWVIILVGSFIIYGIINMWTIYYIIDNNMPSTLYAGVGIFLIPWGFWLWGKIVKPINKKHLVFTIFIVALIIYIILLIDSYQGGQTIKKLKEQGII